MSPKRLIACLFLAAFAALAVVSSAPAGNFDEEKMGCTGDNPATCPAGTVGQPYNLTIYLTPPDGGRGEDFGCATFQFQGSYPPGLSVSDEGYITGTPTQAGNFDFYLVVNYNKPGCRKTPSDDRFIIEIKPAVPKLTIGPESAPSATVNAPYSLQMTANLADPKTWSLAGGTTLPAGLTLNPSTGLISGTPTTAESKTFTVQASIDAQRTDTKTLTINVRNPLTIGASDLFDEANTARTEVGVSLKEPFAPTGGHGPYTVVQTGTLPPGVAFDIPNATVHGHPITPGTWTFTITATDSEGRTASYAGKIVVAQRLQITTRRLKPGKVGKAYRSKLVSLGGVAPVAWRVKRGPLPKGIRFDKLTGAFVGIPARAGTWVIAVEARDSLGVKAPADVAIVVAPAPAKKKR